MRALFAAAVLLALPTQAVAYSAFYAPKAVAGRATSQLCEEGARFPALMIVIGEADFCSKLREAIETSWSDAPFYPSVSKRVVASIYVFNDSYDFNRDFAIDESSAVGAVLTVNEPGDAWGGEDVASGHITLKADEIVGNAPVMVKLDIVVPPDMPALASRYRAEYCPAMTALINLAGDRL